MKTNILRSRVFEYKDNNTNNQQKAFYRNLSLIKNQVNFFLQAIFIFYCDIKVIGHSEYLHDDEKRKLTIFNQLNFFGVITGIMVPVGCLILNQSLPLLAWAIACSPALISLLVLYSNHNKEYELASILYFVLYPIGTSMVYAAGLNVGIELFFILYSLLSVFFIQRFRNIVFSFCLSMLCYFMVAVMFKNYKFELEAVNFFFYAFNNLLAIGFIFYALFLIKKENTDYQVNILNKNFALHKNNLEIENQKKQINEKAELLEKQTVELTELNTLKNKLFSVIAHDLKTPMYALRNLFSNIQQHNLPVDEIKTMIPDVVNDLNYTTGLMENMLQWAKSQMQSDVIQPQNVDVSQVTSEVMKLLRLQAEAKQIYIENKIDQPVYVYADKEMINLVLRNLISNAIKFTPVNGYISIAINEMPSFVEISVQDTGTGISIEAIRKINKKDYFTTKGTASESGTGLGLMLCKDFLTTNGGQMHIESEPGKGSVFSFTLPRSNEKSKMKAMVHPLKLKKIR